MTATITHRGPDDEGFFVRPEVALGMRRLSVIDVAGGHQPISNETGDVWIVFNGEIYNYAELRPKLESMGHVFRTHTDTEAIVHLYESYGEKCVDYLDGMFAFALYDLRPAPRGPRLMLARDRFGKKPLYYAAVGGALIFGSEIKPVLVDPRVKRELDLEALHHYLSMLVIPAPFSIFKDIRKLPAGCLLVCDSGGFEIRRYWDYLSFVKERTVPEVDLMRDIRELIFAAVSKRLIAEVPLGAFLSGGMDSTAVVAVMSQLTSQPVETFSVGFNGPASNNELPWAKMAAQHYRTHHHEYLLNPDIVETIEEFTQYADEPLAVSSALPTFLLAKSARREITVVLTGDGGDEVFGGYAHYVIERWAAAYRRFPRLLDRILDRAAALGERPTQSSGNSRWSLMRRFVANSRASPGQRRLGWRSGFSEEEKKSLYACRDAPALTPTGRYLDASTVGLRSADPAVQSNCLDILAWLPDEMLAKVDRATMGASLEARCPLLDCKLVEYMAGVSMRVKIPGHSTNNVKHLLRRSLADLIPDTLLNRPKRGFNVAMDHWLRSDLVGYVDHVLSPEKVRRLGLFDPEYVTALIGRQRTGKISAANKIYALLVFSTWAEAWL